MTYSDEKLTAVFFPGRARRQRMAIAEHDFDPFLDDSGELRHDLGLRPAVTAGTDDGRRTADIGPDTAIQLVTFVPAEMEKYFREVFPPVVDRKAPPPPITDALIQKLKEVAPKYGLEFPAAPEGEKK